MTDQKPLPKLVDPTLRDVSWLAVGKHIDVGADRDEYQRAFDQAGFQIEWTDAPWGQGGFRATRVA